MKRYTNQYAGEFCVEAKYGEWVQWDEVEDLLVQIWELSKNNPEVIDLLSDHLGSSEEEDGEDTE